MTCTLLLSDTELLFLLVCMFKSLWLNEDDPEWPPAAPPDASEEEDFFFLRPATPEEA